MSLRTLRSCSSTSKTEEQPIGSHAREAANKENTRTEPKRKIDAIEIESESEQSESSDGDAYKATARSHPSMKKTAKAMHGIASKAKVEKQTKTSKRNSLSVLGSRAKEVRAKIDLRKRIVDEIDAFEMEEEIDI